MKKTYLMPQLDIENVVVEQGIATSPSLVEQSGDIETASYYDYGNF